MRERKRLESLLSLEGDLVRRTGDIAAYFDLAGEGENVTADLQRELDLSANWWIESKPRRCFRARTTA